MKSTSTAPIRIAPSTSRIWKTIILFLPVIAGLLLYILRDSLSTTKVANEIMASKAVENLNVFKKPLSLFSKSPLTGFYRDGYCRVGPEDYGNHAVAGVVTDDFLKFSATRGNDLRTIGLTGGCKWCLCTSRWKEAFDAWKRGEVEEEVVPKIHLSSTDQSALRKIGFEDLKRFTADGEGGEK